MLLETGCPTLQLRVSTQRQRLPIKPQQSVFLPMAGSGQVPRLDTYTSFVRSQVTDDRGYEHPCKWQKVASRKTEVW